MSTDAADIKINNGCAPKNALFCCHSPVCLNSSPKILPIDYQQIDNRPDVVVPVKIPDLTKLGMIDVNNIEQQLLAAAAAIQQQNDSGPAAAAAAAASVQPLPTTPIETRLGVVLRRVSPPKKNIIVKKSEPLMGVVLRKVDKQMLAPPKPRKVEHSPPPKKLPQKPISNAAVATAKIPLIAENEKPELVVTLAPKPPKPVNLLRNRPPTEVYKIEGDKIIIIKRIPRAQPTSQAHTDADERAHHDKAHKHGKHHRRHAKGPPKIIQIQVTLFCVLFVFFLLMQCVFQ